NEPEILLYPIRQFRPIGPDAGQSCRTKPLYSRLTVPSFAAAHGGEDKTMQDRFKGPWAPGVSTEWGLDLRLS
ncbi:hypothetical protein, partial [Acidomonas methanolica]|uniref:hypothetical protein n=1 Tax=Acidomonas methanolica TaxID=437 RepID=UPI001C99BC32